jgi:hypothetical protein
MSGDEDDLNMKALTVVNGAKPEDASEAEFEDVTGDEFKDDGSGFQDVQDFASLLEAAQALEKEDARGAYEILQKAAALGRDLADHEIKMLIEAIAHATKYGVKTIKAAWKAALEEEAKLQQQNRAAANAAADAEAQRRQEEERSRIWASCGHLATNPNLLGEMVATAKKLGLVGEEAGARGVYLTCTSRLLATSSVRLLRLGSSASGKNYPVETVLRLIPELAVVQISGASPKVLPYFGGDQNRGALQHKVVYIPEAVILESKEGVSNEFVPMFRTLISEGKLVYWTVVIHKDGTRETVRVVKDGPIAAILTTARDVDREMKTRSLVQETDESGEQTEAIVKKVLSKPEPEPDLLPWLDLQLWLELEAPYRVDIPFREAINKGYAEWHADFLAGAAMRMRRDINSFLTAIEASALLHKAKRDVVNGAIVATTDDYRHAYAAFGEGLATVHGRADAKVIATVEAIEAMAAEQREGGNDSSLIKVPLRALAKRLRVGSPMTASVRLAAAETYGAIEQVDTGSGSRSARYYEVHMTPNEIRAEPEMGVFPPPEYVSKNFFSGGG